MPSWRFVDAAKIAAENPYTFERPSDAEISRLKPGDDVKLGFERIDSPPGEPTTERMWVEVSQLMSDGRFIGKLENQPAFIKDLQIGTTIEFEAAHIYTTSLPDDPSEGESLVQKYSVRCFTTMRILNDGAKVGALYREAPEFPGDSGWRISANDESEAYMSDASNLAMVSLGAVLRCDPAIVDLLDSPVGSSFELSANGETFVPV